MSIELLLWMLLVFFIGCIIGYFLRWFFAPEHQTAATATAGVATMAAGGSAAASTAPQDSEPARTAAPESKPAPTIKTTTAKVTKPTAAKPVPAVSATVSSAPKAATKKPAATAKPSATAKPQAASKPKAAAKSKVKVTGKPKRPRGLAQARRGKADNLQQISGVGPKLEKTLHGLGFYHFDQIANWNSDEVTWVDEHLRFKGRIDRDEWIKQAKQLAKSGSQARKS